MVGSRADVTVCTATIPHRKDFSNSMSGWADANPKWREEALRS